MLGLGHRSSIFLFVQTKLAVHGRFFVEHLPDRGRFVSAVFLIGEGLEGAVEGKRKGDGDGRGFLVSHSAERVIVNMTGQEKFRVDKVYDTIIHMFMPRTKLPKGSVSVTFRLPRPLQKILAGQARREGLSFSDLVRRALRREIKATRISSPPSEH